MSETPGSRPLDASSDASSEDARAGSTRADRSPRAAADETHPTPEQPYDVSSSAHQYGQPPATGYQPPADAGQSAPVRGQGPSQYGQPEHGQASYAQEGFPAPGSGPGGYEPTDPGYGEQPGAGAPTFGAPGQGYPPQGQGYGQQPPGQQPYGQQPYGGQPPYQGQQQYQGQPPYGGQGYPPQSYAAAPMSDNDQRLWATLTHISIPFFGFIGPLVAYLILKDRSTFLKGSTTEALNFSILYSIIYLVGIVLTAVLVGGFVILLAAIAALVLCILAAVASNKGELYRYPVNWRLVK